MKKIRLGTDDVEKLNEKDIESYFVNEVKKAGGVARKWQSMNVRGVPDRIVILPYKILFVELKAPGKKPTKLQKENIQMLQSFGHQVWVIDTKEGVDDFVKTEVMPVIAAREIL